LVRAGEPGEQEAQQGQRRDESIGPAQVGEPGSGPEADRVALPRAVVEAQEEQHGGEEPEG
jgi:hypothetical protein